ncbi:MAG TPA: hypothetical protein VFM70_11665 [Salinimicrobium sp.]|nr:hypothetical protein [Salinimicrobium sp.]
MEEKKSMGGYLGLELDVRNEYYPNAIKLNSGRNGLEYILRANNYSKVYIAYYTCDAVLKPIERLNINYEFYRVNKSLEPEFDFQKIKPSEAFLYTNYFGLKSSFIKNELQTKKNIIIDNAQAFFSKPVGKLATFYSPRKFFGVPDGSYVFLDRKFNIELEKSTSYDNAKHLIKQLDLSTEEGYKDYLNNEAGINDAPLQEMSNFTQRLLKSIDYNKIEKKRKENFNFLKKELAAYNELDLFDTDEGPLHYPLLLKGNSTNIKEELIKQKIFIPTYWDNVLEWIAGKDCWEKKLVNNLIPLPIDQRYNIEDMKYLVRIVKQLMNDN